MSDGNFNRNLLPYNNFQSGLRAGRAQMKTLALDSFKSWLRQRFPNDTDEELEQMYDEFKKMLD